MLKRGLRLLRTHPVLVAFLIGMACGAGNVIMIEVGGMVGRNATGILPLLASGHRTAGQINVTQGAFLMLIEAGGNLLGFGILFAGAAAVVVAIRRIFRRAKREQVL
jgi:hypothetical protein